MGAFRFRAKGLTQSKARWFRRLSGYDVALSSKVLAATTLTGAIIYATHQPGTVQFTTPPHETYTDAMEVTVRGRIENAAVRKIGLDVNGEVRDVDVAEGIFTSRVPLVLGQNTIRPLSTNLGPHVLTGSESLVLHAVKNPGPIKFIDPLPAGAVLTDSVTVLGEVTLSERVQDHQLSQITLSTESGTVVAPINDGQFRVEVELNPGTNRIRGLAGPRLESGSRLLTIERLEHPGAITITHPTQDQLFDVMAVDVAGTVDNPSIGSIRLVVNGQEHPAIPVNEDGEFFAKRVALQPNENQIHARYVTATSNSVRAFAPAVFEDFEHPGHGWKSINGAPDSTMPTLSDHGNPGQCIEFVDQTAAPMDLVFVIDTSGSMGNRLRIVKAQAAEIIRSLRKKYHDVRIGVVGFATGARVLIPLTPTGAGRAASDIVNRIGTAESGLAEEGDDQYLGIVKALHMQWRGSETSKSIIVITDEGAANGPRSFRRFTINDKASAILKNQLTPDDLKPDEIKKRARSSEVRIFAIIVGDESTAVEHAGLLVDNQQDDILKSDDEHLVEQIVTAANYAGEIFDLGIWQAPDEVVTQMRSAMGRTLRFDILQEATSEETKTLHADDIALVGSKQTLVYRFPESDRVANRWQRHGVTLSGSAGWMDEATRQVVGDNVLGRVLKDLQRLQIRADFRPGPEISALDNVMLSGPAGPSTATSPSTLEDTFD